MWPCCSSDRLSHALPVSTQAAALTPKAPLGQHARAEAGCMPLKAPEAQVGLHLCRQARSGSRMRVPPEVSQVSQRLLGSCCQQAQLTLGAGAGSCPAAAAAARRVLRSSFSAFFSAFLCCLYVANWPACRQAQGHVLAAGSCPCQYLEIQCSLSTASTPAACRQHRKHLGKLCRSRRGVRVLEHPGSLGEVARGVCVQRWRAPQRGAPRVGAHCAHTQPSRQCSNTRCHFWPFKQEGACKTCACRISVSSDAGCVIEVLGCRRSARQYSCAHPLSDSCSPDPCLTARGCPAWPCPGLVAL